MITFEEWEACDVITAEFAPAQYEKALRQSISDLNRDTEPELSLMAIRADAQKGLLSDFSFVAGPLTRQPVDTPVQYIDL